MSKRIEPFIALRYLRSKRKEVFISIITVISVLGIAISVMVLDMTLAIMTGFERTFQGKLIDVGSHISVKKYGGLINNWDTVIDRVKSVPEVVSAEAYTYNQAMVSAPGIAHGLLIRGVANTSDAKTRFKKLLAEGYDVDAIFRPANLEIQRPDGQSDNVELPPIILGQALMERLGVAVGSPVTILAPSFSSTPQGIAPKLKRFVVVGVWHTGLGEYELGVAYTSIADAQKFFNMGDYVSGIDVMVHNMFDAPSVALKVRETLGGETASFLVTDWTEMNRPLWEAMKLEKTVYFIVLLLLILIASFSIVSTLVMLVMEKSKDIAILKSLGASDGTILRVFLLQGVIIGVVGTIVGSISGYLGCLGLRTWGFPINPTVFSIDKVPVEMLPENFVVVAVAAFVITSCAGIYPARRAAKLNPAEILRYE